MLLLVRIIYLRSSYVLQAVSNERRSLSDYEVESCLHKMKQTSSGYNDLPCWVFKQCSYELATVVAAICNKFQTGTVPVDWSTAVVTPVPKIPCPSSLADYRPISVTPILSRVAEKNGSSAVVETSHT